MIARSTLSRMRRFARGADGSAGIELGFGSAALLTISMLCFDLYSVVSTDTAGARSAVVLAEFVSLETEPQSNDLAALGEFLYRHEFQAPVNVAYVISAVQRPTGEDERAAVLWTDDTIRFGDEEVTTELAVECAKRGREGWRAALLAAPRDVRRRGGRGAVGRRSLLAAGAAGPDLQSAARRRQLPHVRPARPRSGRAPGHTCRPAAGVRLKMRPITGESWGTADRPSPICKQRRLRDEGNPEATRQPIAGAKRQQTINPERT